jgi:DNA recombination protein Rad52
MSEQLNKASFSDETKSALGAKLDKSFVKERKQGSGNFMLSYIEGWYAIDQANKIFGYDNWTMEFDYVKEVFCEKSKDKVKRGGNEYDEMRWHVSYIAQCRLNVMGVIRVDVGNGHGIDRDCGLAHESACKEAATDAMKRAFRTFGNPFGLALYDKKQEMVSSDPTELLISDNMLFEKHVIENVTSGRITELGLRTLCKLLGAARPAEIASKYRKSALGLIADDTKLRYLNEGMNTKGEVIIEDVKPTQSIDDLKAKAAALMPTADAPAEKEEEAA